MVNHGRQVRKPAVMVEAAFGARKQAPKRRSAVPFVGRAVRLEVVKIDQGPAADFVGRVQIPSRLRELMSWDVFVVFIPTSVFSLLSIYSFFSEPPF